MALRVSWEDGAEECSGLRLHFSELEPSPTFSLGSNAEPLLVWSWGDGRASVMKAYGPDELKTVDEAIEGDARVRDRVRTVVLRARRPPSARFVLLTLAGCQGEERYLTASTFSELRFADP